MLHPLRGSQPYFPSQDLYLKYIISLFLSVFPFFPLMTFPGVDYIPSRASADRMMLENTRKLILMLIQRNLVQVMPVIVIWPSLHVELSDALSPFGWNEGIHISIYTCHKKCFTSSRNSGKWRGQRSHNSKTGSTQRGYHLFTINLLRELLVNKKVMKVMCISPVHWDKTKITVCLFVVCCATQTPWMRWSYHSFSSWVSRRWNQIIYNLKMNISDDGYLYTSMLSVLHAI